MDEAGFLFSGVTLVPATSAARDMQHGPFACGLDFIVSPKSLLQPRAGAGAVSMSELPQLLLQPQCEYNMRC